MNNLVFEYSNWQAFGFPKNEQEQRLKGIHRALNDGGYLMVSATTPRRHASIKNEAANKKMENVAGYAVLRKVRGKFKKVAEKVVALDMSFKKIDTKVEYDSLDGLCAALMELR